MQFFKSLSKFLGSPEYSFFEIRKKSKYYLQRPKNMAEAGIEAFGVVIGLAISLAVTCVTIRGKGHHEQDSVCSSGRNRIQVESSSCLFLTLMEKTTSFSFSLAYKSCNPVHESIFFSSQIQCLFEFFISYKCYSS